MNYLLLIISGLLGIFGVLKETHKFEKREGKKVKVLAPWGWVTLIALGITLSLTIYEQYVDQKEATKVSEENEYLKLSELTVGPYYTLRFIFEDSIFSDNITQRTLESLEKKQLEINKIQTKYDGDSSGKASALNFLDFQYDKFYIDSFSKINLFPNCSYLTTKRLYNIGQFQFSLGTLLNGTVDFGKNGTVFPNIIYNQTISALLEDSLSKGFVAFEPKNLVYYKNEIDISGQIPMQIRAGTIYQAVLRDYRKNICSSSFKLYFDSIPNEELMEESNRMISKIKEIRLEISYDPEATRWLIIPFVLDKKPKQNQEKYPQMTIFSTIQMAKIKQLPYVGDIAE